MDKEQISARIKVLEEEQKKSNEEINKAQQLINTETQKLLKNMGAIEELKRL